MLAAHDLKEHYQILLGLLPPWVVTDVKLSLPDKRVDINIAWPMDQLINCPECDTLCPIYDHRPTRNWRHLDTMQFQTIITSSIPRSSCPQHGIKTIHVPWAAPHSRFTLMFEGFAIEVLKATKNVKEAARLLSLSWDQVREVQFKAVERGLQRRKLEKIAHIGIDEKSFLKGHQYASVMTDLDHHRVVEVTEGRTLEAASDLWKGLPEGVRVGVKAVSMDMWHPFQAATEIYAPQAAIVHDKFHVSKYLNEAVDKVRRAEHKVLLGEDDETLKGSKYLFLKALSSLSAKEKAALEQLQQQPLKAARAWSLKETFTLFWSCPGKQAAEVFFKRWYYWATHSRLEPMVKVAKMLKRHLSNLLTYMEHPISNAMAEGFNSKIQMIKSNARGFRGFLNYRMSILFFCGGLDMNPC